MSTVQFAVMPEKKTTTTRLARGTIVGAQGPQSPLYTGTTKAAVDDVVLQSANLKAKIDANNTARGAYKKTRTALSTGVVAWDAAFDVLVSTGQKVCTTPEDGAGLGLPAIGGKVKHVFAMPLSIDLVHDLKLDVLRIQVHRAPGMKNTCVQISTDPTNPALWKELDGLGAVHRIPNPPPGMLYVRAAARNASTKSAFTTPVSILVK